MYGFLCVAPRNNVTPVAARNNRTSHPGKTQSTKPGALDRSVGCTGGIFVRHFSLSKARRRSELSRSRRYIASQQTFKKLRTRNPELIKYRRNLTFLFKRSPLKHTRTTRRHTTHGSPETSTPTTSTQPFGSKAPKPTPPYVPQTEFKCTKMEA